MVGLQVDWLEEFQQNYYQQLALYQARLPYQNFVKRSKYLDFQSYCYLLFVDAWSIIEEEDSVYGLLEVNIPRKCLPQSNCNFEIGQSCSEYLDFRSNFGCLIFLDSPRNRSSLLVDGRYWVNVVIHLVGLQAEGVDEVWQPNYQQLLSYWARIPIRIL